MPKIAKIITRRRFYLLVFILLALLAGFGIWVWRKNAYTKATLRLEILGPTSIDFGEKFNYTVDFKNNGDTELQDAKLVFEYPSNSVVPDGKSLWQEISLNNIYPGEEKTLTFPAQLIGQEGEVKTAKATLSYQPKNLSATYQSQTSFATQINFLPLTFEFDLPSKVDPGKNFSFNINYFSNIDYSLSNLAINVTYPSDFQFKSSDPSSLDQTSWDIPTLDKTQGGRVQISGKMQGSIGTQEMFDAKIGIWQNGEFILLKEISKSIALTEPALNITQQINGNPDYVASPGDQLHYEIFFQNVGDQPLSNLTLSDTLSGDALDFQSIRAVNASSTQNGSIVWGWQNNSSLQFLAPQQTGKVEFWINLKKDFGTSTSGTKSIQNNVSLNQVTEQFTTKVNSTLTLNQLGFYQDEVFGNSGPIPPKVGQTTTYTVTWQVKNYSNQVNNVKVTAVLPDYVQLTGNIFPQDARITFDSASRELVWEVGDMASGEGVSNSPPNVSFQVGLTPTASMKGQTPIIIKNTQITGEDSWTNRTVNEIVPDLKTDLPDDPSITSGMGVVN